MPAPNTESPAEFARPDIESVRPEVERSRKETAETLDDVGSAVSATAKGGIGAKFALARIGLRLARRYPVAAVIVVAAGIALMVGRRHTRRVRSVY
jgi:hypothetical protein